MNLFVLLFTSYCLVFSSDLLEVNYSGISSSSSSSKARSEIIDQAVKETSYKYINELIGESKATKNQNFIEKKIIADYLKYIPIIKVNDLKKAEKGGLMADVAMKFSIENLKELLLKQGLLYEMGGAPRVMPLISFTDKVNSQIFNWWTGASQSEGLVLEGLFNDFSEALKSALWEQGFFGFSPVQNGFAEGIPEVFRQDRPRTEDLLFIGQYFNSSIVIRGGIDINRMNLVGDTFRIDIKLQALQSSNGRVIGEVIRQYETDSGPFQVVVHKKFVEVKESISKDLVVQIQDAWQKGTFGSSLVKLTLKGNLNYQSLEDFKKQILSSVRAIRSLRARLYAPGAITFEVDSSISSTELAESIKKKSFSHFKVEVDEVEGSQLALLVKVL